MRGRMCHCEGAAERPRQSHKEERAYLILQPVLHGWGLPRLLQSLAMTRTDVSAYILWLFFRRNTSRQIFTENFQNCNKQVFFERYNQKLHKGNRLRRRKNAIKPPFFCVQYLYFYNRKKLLLCNQYEDFIIFLKIDMKNHNSFSKNCCIFLQLCVKCI